MKNRFEQFRIQAQQMQQTPSPQTWERLSARLEQHKKHSKIIWWQRLAVAASFLVLLSVACLWSLYWIAPKVQFAALEELAPTSSKLPYDVASINRQYALGYIHVEEGTPSKRLVAAFNYFYDEPTAALSTPKLSDTLKKVWMDTLLHAQHHFDWLLGTWRGNLHRGRSVEEWKKGKNDILEGKGYIVQAEDTLFMERMRLVNKGKDWFYILQLNTFLATEAYQLKYLDKDQAIFVNNKMRFPHKIVLKRHAEDGFSTIFLPVGAIELAPEQLNFVTQRNVLMADKAVRNLWRL
ncbi:MAG: hypothetical protein HC912_00245 [Saprospiraceae bacterium]|nr:hypothetical protein [Saprospiraceae bacterium]